MSNIKLKQTDDTGSVTLKAGSSGSNDVELTLPTAIGSNDQFLKLSGVSGQTGALSFATPTDTTTPANDTVTAAKLDLSIVQGDLIYGTGTDTWAKLAKGSASQVLSMNSGATAPEWAAAGGGELKQIKWEFISQTHTGSSDWTDTGFEIDFAQTSANNFTVFKLMGGTKNEMGYGNPPPRCYLRLLEDDSETRKWEMYHTNLGNDNTLNEDGGGGYDWRRKESCCFVHRLQKTDTTSRTYKIQFKEEATTHYGLIELNDCIFFIEEYEDNGN